MRAAKAIWLQSTLVIISLSIGAAQGSSAGPLADDSHAVTITFFAEDESGSPVNNLQVSDLSVRDNKKPPLSIVSLHSAENLPLRLGILIDNKPGLGVAYSKKQLDYEPTPKWAADFVEEMLSGPDDKAFIASYSTILHGTKFVSREQLQPVDINQFLQTDAPNFLGSRDAIRTACKEVFGDDPAGRERRVLIVALGFDQAGRSLSDDAQMISAAQRAGVKVLVFGGTVRLSAWSWFPLPAPRSLWTVAPETGGFAFSGPAHDTKRQIDSMYSLTYVPAEPYQAGQLRKLELKITTNKS